MAHAPETTTRRRTSPAASPLVRSLCLLAVLAVGLCGLLSCQLFASGCKFCASSLSAGKVRTPEGWNVCPECNRTAVRDLQTAQTLVAQVRGELAGLGIYLPWGEIQLKLGPTPHPQIYARCEALRYANGGVAALWIRVVPGLPQAMFKGTAAHELTHAWAYLHGSPLRQDEVLSEGAPTLVEYTYLGQNPSAYAKHRRNAIETSNNRIYGEGMRRLQAYAKANGGLAGVLTLLRTAQTIPRGY